MSIDSHPVSGPVVGSPVAKLLRKEWLVFGPRDRVFAFGVFFLAALQAVAVAEFYFFLGLALVGTLAIWVPIVEWYQEADQMLFSLPVRRDAAVLARYASALISGAIGGVIWNTTGRILLPVLYAAKDNPPFWMSLEGVLAFITAFGLLVVLFFPLFFRWGAGKGGLIFLGMSLGLLALGYATAGIAAGPAVGRASGFLLPSELVRTRVAALLGSLGPAGALTVILVGLAILFAVSIKISQYWFRRREL